MAAATAASRAAVDGARARCVPLAALGAWRGLAWPRARARACMQRFAIFFSPHSFARRRPAVTARRAVFFLRAAFMDGKKEWNPELDGVLGEVGATGHSPFDWAQLKQLLSAKLEAVS